MEPIHPPLSLYFLSFFFTFLLLFLHHQLFKTYNSAYYLMGIIHDTCFLLYNYNYKMYLFLKVNKLAVTGYVFIKFSSELTSQKAWKSKNIADKYWVVICFFGVEIPNCLSYIITLYITLYLWISHFCQRLSEIGKIISVYKKV